MIANICRRRVPELLLLALLASSAHAMDGGELGRRATWANPEIEDIRDQVTQWVASQKPDGDVQDTLDDLWSEDSNGRDILTRLAETFALVDPVAREVVEICSAEPTFTLPPRFESLSDEEAPRFVRDNLRLLYGRWLAQYEFYDEALEQLNELTVDDVVDPASLLFYQSVVHHRLLKKDECLLTLTKLLENEPLIPRRYKTVARLMEADIKPLKTDSLDEVSRLMEDIERRLGFGRAGTRVRKEEDDVIAKLDKMIEKLQQQQQQQQQQSGSSQGGSRSGNPAQDSMPLGGRGPGDVDEKEIGDESGWGNLPPKQRQEALQQIGKDLPAHFRDVIEEYFRKLARDGGK